MRPERFKQSTAGQPLRIGQGATAYWAFVLSPLPPTVEFDIELVQSLSAADRMLGELAGLGRMLTNPNLLTQPFIRREAVLSSRIEGTQADITNLYAYEAGQLHLPGFSSLVPEEDVREVLNYVHALEYGTKRLNTLPVSLRLVRELHERLMEDVRGDYATPGQFRQTQNWIGSPGCTLNEADFVPPPVAQMHEALADWELYIHQDDSLPPLIRLALIHYQFEAIHPFIDGNGRVGRLLNSLLLIDWKLLPFPILYLSAYFERHRSTYYHCLMAVSRYGDWYGWIKFFLDGVVFQASDAILRAKKLQDLQVSWRQKLLDIRSSALLLRLVDHLFESPILTIPQAQQAIDASYPGTKNNIDKLVELGMLKQITQSGYNKFYVAPKILQIITNLEK